VVEDLGWFADLQAGQDLALALGGGRAFGDVNRPGSAGGLVSYATSATVSAMTTVSPIAVCSGPVRGRRPAAWR
jgi:hypothetical protein